MRAPAPLGPSYWTLKRLIILVGFILTMIGTLGSYLYVEPVQKQAATLDDGIRSNAVTTEILKNADAEYFMFEQQGALIFAISAANTNEDARDTISKLRQLSLLDRTFAVRQIFGQLAIAGQLGYRETSDAYQALIDRARADFSLANFLAVKAYEKKYISLAQTRSGQLQAQRYALVQRKAAIDLQVERRRLVLLILTSLGSAFLLAANLIATRSDDAKREQSKEEPRSAPAAAA